MCSLRAVAALGTSAFDLHGRSPALNQPPTARPPIGSAGGLGLRSPYERSVTASAVFHSSQGISSAEAGTLCFVPKSKPQSVSRAERAHAENRRIMRTGDRFPLRVFRFRFSS